MRLPGEANYGRRAPHGRPRGLGHRLAAIIRTNRAHTVGDAMKQELVYRASAKQARGYGPDDRIPRLCRGCGRVRAGGELCEAVAE
jgi:hypothetical protein